jgi:hypothetical protein
MADYSLFTHLKGSSFIALLVYVDDVAIDSNDPQAVSSFITLLNDKFKLKDLGPLKYFLGLEIARSTNEIFVCQREYTLKILEDSGLLASKLVKFPMEQNLKLSKDEGDLLSDSTSYKRLVGRPLYLTITIPEFSFFSSNIKLVYRQSMTTSSGSCSLSLEIHEKFSCSWSYFLC